MISPRIVVVRPFILWMFQACLLPTHASLCSDRSAWWSDRLRWCWDRPLGLFRPTDCKNMHHGVADHVPRLERERTLEFLATPHGDRNERVGRHTHPDGPAPHAVSTGIRALVLGPRRLLAARTRL